MTDVCLGAVHLPGKGHGVAYYEPAHPGYLTVLVRGTNYFVARSRVTFLPRSKP